MENLTAQFKTYLTSCGASRATIKNYLSDLAHFRGWYGLYLRNRGWQRVPETSGFFGQLTGAVVAKYRDFLVANQTSKATTNRRLSTLRKIGTWGVDLGILRENPTEKVENISGQVTITAGAILEQFGKHLSSQKLAEVTRKNYVSDVRQFLAWLEAGV